MQPFKNVGSGELQRISRKKRNILIIIASYLLTLSLVLSGIFVLLRFSPGNPIGEYLNPNLSHNLYSSIKESYGLDRSIGEQYLTFIGNIIRGDFGVSYSYNEPVIAIISDTAFFTICFAIVSLIVQITLPLLLFLFVRKHSGSWFEITINKVSLLVYSIPTIIIGISLVYIFSVVLKILPFSDLQSAQFDNLNVFHKFLDIIWHMVLPVLTLSLPGAIIYYNYLRKNAEIIENSTFIKFLLANGYDKRVVLLKHILPNSLSPLISILGTELGILLGGAVITETLFNLPGIGRLTVSAILSRDYPLIIGCVFFTTIVVMITNLLADVLKISMDLQLKQNIKNHD